MNLFTLNAHLKTVLPSVYDFHSIAMYHNSLISSEFIFRAGINQKEKLFEGKLDPIFQRKDF